MWGYTIKVNIIMTDWVNLINCTIINTNIIKLLFLYLAFICFRNWQKQHIWLNGRRCVTNMHYLNTMNNLFDNETSPKTVYGVVGGLVKLKPRKMWLPQWGDVLPYYIKQSLYIGWISVSLKGFSSVKIYTKVFTSLKLFVLQSWHVRLYHQGQYHYDRSSKLKLTASYK